MSTEEQDLVLAQAVRELKETDRLIAALGTKLTSLWSKWKDEEASVNLAIMQNRRDPESLLRARNALVTMPDKQVLETTFEEMRAAVLPAAALRVSIAGLT